MPTRLEQLAAWPLERVLTVMQGRLLTQTTYCGIPTVCNPLDWWVYQEIICERNPDYIIEIGNYRGGRLLALAHLCQARLHGWVIGVDLDHGQLASEVSHQPRIRLVTGDAATMGIAVQRGIPSGSEVLIIEDSSHEYANTLAVLRAYSPLVQPGGYFVVEDTICWHGLREGPRPGPYEAVQTFLAEDPTFEADLGRESFLVTWHPGGWLRRKYG